MKCMLDTRTHACVCKDTHTHTTCTHMCMHTHFQVYLQPSIFKRWCPNVFLSSQIPNPCDMNTDTLKMENLLLFLSLW